jgi:hypothetical protein
MGVALRKKRLIFLLCAGLLFCGVLFFLIPRASSIYSKTMAALTEKVEEALEETWLVQVDIEGLRFSFFRPEFVGVKVYTLDGQPLLTAEWVRVRLNWFALFFGRKVSEALRGVELNEPVLWLDATEEGGLAFPKIKKGGASAMLRFVVKIHDGDLQVRTGRSPAAAEKWLWGDFTAVNGRVDLRAYPRVTAAGRFSSCLDPRVRGRLYFEHCYQEREGYYEISAGNSTAAIWGGLVNTRFKLLPGLSIIDGEADFSLCLLKQKQKRLTLDYARVKMAGVTAEYAGIPESLEEIKTEFIVSPEKIDVKEFSGSYCGGNLTFSGWIQPEETFRVDLQLAAENFPLVEWTSFWPVLRDLELAGKAGVNLQIRGALSHPEIQGKIRLAGAGLQVPGTGWRFDDLWLAGDCSLDDGGFTIDRLEFGAFGGRFLVAGKLSNLTGEPVVDLEITGKGINLAGFPLAEFFPGMAFENRIPDLAGRGDLQATVYGPLSRLQSKGQLAFTGGAVAGWEYAALTGEYSWNGTRLTAGLTLEETTGGRGVLTGWWEPQSGCYHGEVVCRSLEFHPEWLGPAAGRFSGWSGKISGSVLLERWRTDAGEKAGPTAGAGWLELYDLGYKGASLPGRLLLRAEMASDRLRITDSYYLSGSGQLALAGEVSWEDGLAYEIRAEGNDFSCDGLLSLLPLTGRPVQEFPALKGLVDLTLVANGGPRPVVTGYLTAKDLLFADFSIDRGKFSFSWQDGKIYLSDGRLQKGKEELAVSGVIGADGLDLVVTADGFPLSALTIPGYNQELTGLLKLDARINGPFASPVITGEVEAEQLLLAGFLLEKVAGAVQWQDGVLSIGEMRAFRGAQELQAHGKIAFHSEPVMDLEVWLEKAEMAELFQLIGLSPAVAVTGKVTGAFQLAGPLETPTVTVTARLEEGRLGDLPVTGEADLQIRDSTVVLNRLFITESGEKGQLTATAFYQPGQEFRVMLDVDGFFLPPLAALAGYQSFSSGEVDLRLAVAMNSQGVTGEFAGSGKDLTISGISLPGFTFSGRLAEAGLYLQGEDLLKKKFAFQGRIPLDYRWLKPLLLPPVVADKTGKTEMELVLAGAEMSLFNLILPQPLIDGGTIDGKLVLKGEKGRFYLDGEVKAAGVSGSIPGLPEKLRGVGIELRFAEDRIDLKRLAGRYGKGDFRGEGYILMNGIRPEKLELKLGGHNLHYTNAMFNGEFDADLSLTGPATDPLLKGEVLVEKTRISLASTGGLPANFDLRLDLNFKTGRDVYFRQYGLASIPLQGQLHVGGRLSNPEITGELSASRGWINVYGDTFQVTKTKAEFRPEYGLMPYLDLEASLYLTGTQITLATQGWAGNELFFTLSSNPAKSREEIFAMLNWSEQLQDPESLSLLKLIRGNIAAVTDGILGPFFDEFRQLIQVDLFNLEQDRAFGGLRMSIGKALGRDVFLSYRRNLSTLSEEVWTLEGRLTLNLSLLGEYSTNQGWQWRIFYNIWL